MNKGQSSQTSLKNILKLFKMNEEKISTLLGVVVVFLLGMMIVNYFKSANLSVWKGSLLGDGASTTVTEEKKDMVAEKTETYKVVRGDDLWNIAERHYKSGYNYVDIIKENNLPKSGLIEPGMELKLPKVAAKKITLKETVAGATTDTNKVETKMENVKTAGTIDTDIYTTVNGDTLWSVAVRAYGDGYKWTKIYWENKAVLGNDPNMLYSGVKITLPKI